MCFGGGGRGGGGEGYASHLFNKILGGKANSVNPDQTAPEGTA